MVPNVRERRGRIGVAVQQFSVGAHEARHADVALFDEPRCFRVYADARFLVGHQSGCPVGSVAEDDGDIRHADVAQARADFHGDSEDERLAVHPLHEVQTVSKLVGDARHGDECFTIHKPCALRGVNIRLVKVLEGGGEIGSAEGRRSGLASTSVTSRTRRGHVRNADSLK